MLRESAVYEADAQNVINRARRGVPGPRWPRAWRKGPHRFGRIPGIVATHVVDERDEAPVVGQLTSRTELWLNAVHGFSLTWRIGHSISTSLLYW